MFWIFPSSIAYGQDSNQKLKNVFLRFGNGTENSINESGNLKQPFYNVDEGVGWEKLTFSNYSLDYKIGVGGVGTSEWNINGVMGQNIDMVPQDFKDDNYDSNGHGNLIVTGEINVGTSTLQITNSYTLDQYDAFIQVRTTIKNIGTDPITNLRYWVGTRDDHIGGSDRPKKERGNINGSLFQVNTSSSERSKALKIANDTVAILMYTRYPLANTAFTTFDYTNFTAATIDPAVVPVSIESQDSSYGLFFRMNDLPAGESDEILWYYAASIESEFEDILKSVSEDAIINSPPTVVLIDDDLDNTLINGDSVLVTATFNKAMKATPTVEIDGSVLEPTPMSATSSSAIWVYTIDVDTLFSLDGTYALSVSGTDINGYAFAGTDSLTYIVDTATPTVTLTDDHADGYLVSSDV
ncbi:MAG: hypothetical protein ABF256_08290, partial [Candidatus Arcticimaribacter sp.]